jgi:peptidoglycan/LPS O-acetylase OafA/YrhL
MNENSLIKYPQLDFIKGLAIISVIILHSTPEKYFTSFYGIWYIGQAVPIFFIIFGITTSISLNKIANKSFRGILSKKYLIEKAERYYLPFLPLCLLSILFTHIIHYSDFSIVTFFTDLFLSLLGKFPPYGGPGDYFVSDLIQLLVIAPVLYFANRKNPAMCLIGSVFINIAFELIAPYFPDYDYMYRRCAIRYLGAVALGLYISEDFLRSGYVSFRKKKYYFIIPLFIFSMVYLLMFNGTATPFFRPEWETQNILSFFYPLTIVIFLLNYYKYFFRIMNKRVIALIQTIGKASYHIFTFQIAYFVYVSPFAHGLINSGKNLLPVTILELMMIAVALIFTIAVGFLFYRLEQFFLNQRKGINCFDLNLKASAGE